MGVIKQVKKRNLTTQGFDYTDIGAEAQYVDVSYDANGNIIEDITEPGVVVSSTKSVAEALNDIGPGGGTPEFVGTMAEWIALTPQEKSQYTIVNILDDSETGETVDAVTDGDMRAVTSNAVYDVVSNLDSGHTIVDEEDTEYTQRSKLKFVNASIEDDSENDETVITVEGGGTTIVQKPTVTIGEYTYNGTAQGPTITGLDTGNTIVTNATKTDAGTYTLTIALKNSQTMVWNDMTNADLTYEYIIDKASVEIPTVSGSYTYDTTEKSAVISSFDLTVITQTGNAVGTNAGTYTVYFNLANSNNYEWTDGTIIQKSGNWSIAKATQTITASTLSVTLNSNNLTDTITISGAEGELQTPVSSDTTVVTASLNNNVITVSNVNEKSGTVTVTIQADSTNNYEASNIVSITVVADFLQLVSWSSGTDEQIGAMIDAYYSGSASLADIQSVWSIGDTRNVTLSAMSATGVGESHRSQTVQVQILGFNHDTLTTAEGGKTKALITVDLKNCLRDASVTDDTGQNNTEHGYMNSSNTNVGGWTGCARRTWCNNVFVPALPSYLQSRVKYVNKLTSAGNQSATINTDSDKAFFLSEIEIFGSVTYSKAGEGSQYAWYANAAANKYKLPRWSSSSVSDFWWGRSPCGSDATNFCRVSGSGGNASGAYGLAPAFCL